MANDPFRRCTILVFFVMTISLIVSPLIVAYAGNFYNDVEISFGGGRAQILQKGRTMALSVDKDSGSGFESKNEYLYGKFNMQIKLVPNNSAGIVTSFYLHSQGTIWDEIDFEFLGNQSGDPYIIHTNIYTQGKGNREQQFYLWFDPTANFHTYSILWNPQHIVLYVDGWPIREFKNLQTLGIPYPTNQTMRMYASIWNADDWATRGGHVKTNWTFAPFIALYKHYKASACIWSDGASSCSNNSSTTTNYGWYSQQLDSTSLEMLKWVQNNYMVYNYCTDVKRFPQGLPRECNVTTTS